MAEQMEIRNSKFFDTDKPDTRQGAEEHEWDDYK